MLETACDIELSFDGAEGSILAALPSEVARYEGQENIPYSARKDTDDDEDSTTDESDDKDKVCSKKKRGGKRSVLCKRIRGFAKRLNTGRKSNRS
mmetsp:Transcript_36761/g.110301  ORF Transcript_36761/g.110301 Transcript_36761/m.110301 type:complete len:95 (-) Transcript_36761:313-597(-)